MNWLLYLKTTETCNLNCKHCFTSGTSGPKIFWESRKVSNWLQRFIANANENDTIHCEFHGGEPFLVPVFQMQDIFDECNKLHDNITWGATTNLVFKMYNEHLDLIKGAFNNRIGTSWDRKIRFGNPKQYELWHKNVKTLLSHGVNIKLFISVTKDTLEIEPIVLLRWIRRLGVQEVSFERLTRNGNANLHPDIFPDNKEQDEWFLKMHHQSTQHNARDWFFNETLETIYAKFESGFIKGSTFCRDCEEKLFTLNANGSISGCPNSAPEFQFGHIDDDLHALLNSPKRIENIACERSRDPRCYSCDVFHHCGGDCHQLPWQDDVCGAPKSLMRYLSKIPHQKKIIPIKSMPHV
jgi:radical SAM protein with 4Fe4S-binding SPASM domain